MSKIFISVGDHSADRYAARIMRKIKAQKADVQFIGLGGDEMISEGLEAIIPLNEISVVGFWEVAKKYGFFKRLLNQSKSILKDEKVDLFLPIDYPGFNRRLAISAKELGIPVVYFIAPQLWAWGKNRAEKLKETVDKLLVILPFEEEFFKKEGINASFVGHPLLEEQVFDLSNNERQSSLIAFLPGSRYQEIKKHEELYVETMRELYSLGDYKFGIARPSVLDKSLYKNYLSVENSELWNDSRDLMKSSEIGLVKTGTSNLEAALCGLPFAMVYKTSPITYQLAKRMVNLDHISLVNILSKKEIVPELIQNDAEPKRIAQYLHTLMNDENLKQEMRNQFDRIRSSLGDKVSSDEVAKNVLEYL